MRFFLVSFLLITSFITYGQATISLDFDKPIYVLGEDIYFTAHLMPSQATAQIPKVLRIGLVAASDQKVVHQQKLKIENYQVQGTIPLTLDWKEGYYLLKAYTVFQPTPSVGNATVATIPIYDAFKERKLETSNAQVTDIALPTGSLEISKQTYKRQEEVNVSVDTAAFFTPPSISVRHTETIQSLPTIKQRQYSFEIQSNQTPEDIGMEYGLLNEETSILGLGIHHLKTNEFQWIKPDKTRIVAFQADVHTAQNYQAIAMVNKGAIITSRFANIGPYSFLDKLTPLEDLPFTSLPFNSVVSDYLKKSILQKKYNTLYGGEKLTSRDHIEEESKLQADHTFYLKDYASMTSIEEFLKEVIPFVRIKKKKDQFEIRMFDENKEFTNYNPLFLVDGKIVYDEKEVLAIPIEALSHISIFRQSSTLSTQFNLLGKNGVIALYRKQKDTIEATDYQLSTLPISASKAFKMPTKKGHLPDFRQTIYWTPSLNIARDAQQITFRHSDNVGTFVIIMSGINQKGEQIRKYGFYEVR